MSALDLHVLDRHPPVRRLRGRNATKADLLFYRVGPHAVALKTYRERPFLVRNLLGRFLIRREAAAYRAAGGAPGLPTFYGRLGPFAIATAWLDAEPLSALRDQTLDEEVFERLRQRVDELHRRGLALGDLHHRDVLRTPTGDVVLVDLAMAFWLGPRPGSLRRALFQRARDGDRVAVARICARFSGSDEVAAIAEVGPKAAAWHRRGRRLKRWLDRLRGKRRKPGRASS